MNSTASCAVYKVPDTIFVLVDYQHVKKCPFRWHLVPVNGIGWTSLQFDSTDDMAARAHPKLAPSLVAAVEVARAVDAGDAEWAAMAQGALDLEVEG